MKIVEMQGYGEPETLRLVDRPEPAPAAGAVRVRVRAAAVNPVDWFTRAGAFADRLTHLPQPLVPGWELAGEVLDDAAGFRAGQRVAAMIPWFDTGAGAYAEVVSLDPGWLAEVPDGIDDVTVAALPLNALTASQALDLLDVSPGQTVLVSGASGAVGGFAVQLAAAAGARVLAVASAGDEEYVSGLGAKDVLGRADAAALAAAARRLAPDGVDRVLDAVPVGPALIGAVRDGGAFVTVLDATVPAEERGIRAAKVGVVPDAARLRTLVEVAAAGRLTVRVAETLPLSRAAEAHRRAAAGGLRGKIVLTV